MSYSKLLSDHVEDAGRTLGLAAMGHHGAPAATVNRVPTGPGMALKNLASALFALEQSNELPA